MSEETLLSGENNTDAAEEGTVEPENNETILGGDETSADETSADETSKAPDSYQDFEYPEKFNVDKGIEDGFKAKFKEFDFTQEQAQNVISMMAEATQEQLANHAQQIKNWKVELKNDPEFGKANFDANITAAKKALTHFGGKEVGKLLDASGFGNNPAIVKMFTAIGKAMGEDSFNSGEGGSGEEDKPIHELLYGDMK